MCNIFALMLMFVDVFRWTVFSLLCEKMKCELALLKLDTLLLMVGEENVNKVLSTT